MKTKKIIICLLIATIVASCALKSEQQGINNKGHWSFDDNTATLYIEQEDALLKWSEYIPATEIKKIVFSQSIYHLPDNSFNGLTSLEEIVLPDSLESIGNYSFMNAPSLNAIRLPKNLSILGIRSFDQVNMVIVDENNTNLIEKNNIVYSYDFSSVIFASKQIENATIPNGVNMIEDGAFYNCKRLKTISLPESLKRIGMYAFMGCISLENIQLPNSLEIIEEYAFADCVSLGELHIPKFTKLSYISENYYFTGSGIKRIVFEGNLIDFCFYLHNEENISQVVCLCEPPECYNDHTVSKPDYTIFYLNTYKQFWSPNDETKWNGIDIIGIDAIDEVPPV